MTKKELALAAGKLAVAGMLLTELAGCATSADPHAMTLSAPAAATEKPFPQQLQHAMCVRTVTGGEKTNPLWVSKVDNDGFRSALTASLDGANLSAAGSGGCAYPIEVNLLGLTQPVIGLDATVTSHVNYKVYDSAGQPYLLATVDAPYTAKLTDALIGAQRLKLANEGSIRMSIQEFFNRLKDAKPQ